MNIFAISNSPKECAQCLDDVRLNKMTIETAQLLSNAMHRWCLPDASLVYSPTHMYHPCTAWVAASEDNFIWTRSLIKHMWAEYKWRRMRLHATMKLNDAFTSAVPKRSPISISPFANCTPYKGLDGMDVFKAYKMLLCDKWNSDSDNNREPTWRNRGQPVWRV